MAEQWFVYKNQEQKGPYTLDELKQGISSGEFRNSDLYWNENMGDWKPGNQISQLFQSQSPRPSAPSPEYTQPKKKSGLVKKLVTVVVIVAVLAAGAFGARKLLGGITSVLPFFGGSGSGFVYYDEDLVKDAVNVPFTDLQGYYSGVAKYTKADNIELMGDMYDASDLEYLNERLGKEMVAILEADEYYIDVYTMLPGSTQDYEDSLDETMYQNGVFKYTESFTDEEIGEASFISEAIVLNGNNDYRIVGYYQIKFINLDGDEIIIEMEYDAERGQP
jgi:hypothetical protein